MKTTLFLLLAATPLLAANIDSLGVDRATLRMSPSNALGSNFLDSGQIALEKVNGFVKPHVISGAPFTNPVVRTSLTNEGWSVTAGASTNLGVFTNAGRVDIGGAQRVVGAVTNLGISTNAGRADFGGDMRVNGAFTNIGDAQIGSTLRLNNPDNGLQMGTRGFIRAGADGSFLFFNSAGTGFRGLQFGGASAAFPMIALTNGHARVTAANGPGAVSTNGLVVDGGVYYPSNTFIPSAAWLGVGGYWVGNSNGNLVSVYSLNGSTTVMKVLAP